MFYFCMAVVISILVQQVYTYTNRLCVFVFMLYSRKISTGTGPIGQGTVETLANSRAERSWIGVVMILPQVHLRKPCYDFTFL